MSSSAVTSDSHKSATPQPRRSFRCNRSHRRRRFRNTRSRKPRQGLHTRRKRRCNRTSQMPSLSTSDKQFHRIRPSSASSKAVAYWQEPSCDTRGKVVHRVDATSEIHRSIQLRCRPHRPSAVEGDGDLGTHRCPRPRTSTLPTHSSTSSQMPEPSRQPHTHLHTRQRPSSSAEGRWPRHECRCSHTRPRPGPFRFRVDVPPVVQVFGEHGTTSRPASCCHGRMFAHTTFVDAAGPLSRCHRRQA